MIRIEPELWVERPLAAIAFYEEAFGAQVIHRVGEGEEIVARLEVDGARFWVADSDPGSGRRAPGGKDGATARFLLDVADPAEAFGRAVAAGAEALAPVEEEHGWTVGRVLDPFGHEWEIARTPAEAGSGLARGVPPSPYALLPGTAREALDFYAEVFGAAVEAHTFAELGRSDGAEDAIAHGMLADSPVELYLADAGDGEAPFSSEGLMFSLLGTADPATLRGWFASLAEGGTVVDDLERRPWGAFDGRVVDRYGLPWLIGFEDGGE